MSNARDRLDDFLGRLDGVKPAGQNQWAARCPCRNDDNNPSLSIGFSDERVLVTCHRGNGCSFSEICATVGVKESDLFGSSSDDFSPPSTRSVTPRPKQQVQQKQPDKLTFVKSYDFVNEDGELLFQKVRYVNQDGKKSFRQRRPDGTGNWVYSLGDTPKVLYNLPAVLAAKAAGLPIYVVEGEKDADALIANGEVATTMPGGAGKWLDIHTEALAGAVVEIIADNDEPGKAHAKQVFQELTKAGCSAEIWICPEHKDIADHLASGYEISDLVQFEDGQYIQEFEVQEDAQQIDDDGEEETKEEVSVIAKKVDDLRELLNRTDIDANTLIVKANRIIIEAAASGVEDRGRFVQWNDFIEEKSDDSYEWVIPGLLEKQERVIVVAAEGVGKTMLARQIALCSAAGVHPFSYSHMRPIKTLTVDLENPERIIRRMSAKILASAMKHGHVQRVYGELLIKPAGLDLMKLPDRAILEEAIERAEPELLVMGPIYKSFVDPGGRTSESIVVEIARYLDSLRTRYGCAMWLEHHAPLGTTLATRELRPFGSAVWSRWPEFGISLQPDPTAPEPYVYDVRHFRGARDERQWPLKIKRGTSFPFQVIEFMNVGK